MKSSPTLAAECAAAFFLLGGLVAWGDEHAIAPPASERFERRQTREVPDFQRHVVPLLGRLGCNSAKCHGSFQGRGELRLSLFGFDFASDRAALLAEGSSEEGPRVNAQAAGDSLIVRKPTTQTDHEGGKRFALGSWQHHLLLRWIASGASGAKRPETLARLEVSPREIVFAGPGEKRRLRVFAEWADGTREDVTCLSRFRSNDDVVARLDEQGTVVAGEPGDTHVVVFYDNGVSAVPVIRPFDDRGKAPPRGKPFKNPIDRFVSQKLDKLGLRASPRCTDAEFLRRACIDLTGTLPAPDEIKRFLADTSPNKRDRKIDELLKRPSYAAWWANKLCDFTGCSPTAFGEQTNLEVGYAFSTQWYDWIRRRVAENAPYDELVEGIVLAKSRSPGQSAEDYAAEMSSYVRRDSKADFSKRDFMPHYWMRATIREDKDKALAFAHSFLGIQLQCAQCHKHPFDQWTQDDFKQFTRFFEGVRARGRIGFPQFAAAQRGETVFWPEVYVDSNEKKTLKLLRSGRATVAAGKDARELLMNWMRKKENPWFARAFVNRVWAGYFHVGIVEPPDQFTPAQPAEQSGIAGVAGRRTSLITDTT